MSISKFPNLSTLLSRRSNPAILPISPTRAGNNKPKSLQKTKRTFKPNVTRVDWPINLLSENVGVNGDVLPKLRGVKMQMRRVRDVEKAGGLEGLLLSRASKDLTPFGAYLRSQVFNQLHRIKLDLEAEKRAAAGLPLESGLSAASTIGEVPKAKVPLVEGQ